MIRRLDSRFEAWKRARNAEYHEALADLVRSRARGRAASVTVGPETTQRAFTKYPEEAELIRKRLGESPRVEAGLVVFRGHQQRLEALLDREAERATPVTDLSVQTSVATVLTYSYGSQGGGADRYARGAAQAIADRYLAAGVLAVAVNTSNEMWEVLAHCDKDTKVIVDRRPGLPLREVIRRHWARGVNPRVYYPLLPHGYEEEVGIDCFGHDLREASGGA